ncbi:unnamed protein product [Arctogadus glacialis]
MGICFRDAPGSGHFHSSETLPHHQECPGAIQRTDPLSHEPHIELDSGWELNYCLTQPTRDFKVIEVYDLIKPLPHNRANRSVVGATHPGVYNSAEQLFHLNFRGLSFSFLTGLLGMKPPSMRFHMGPWSRGCISTLATTCKTQGLH